MKLRCLLATFGCLFAALSAIGTPIKKIESIAQVQHIFDTATTSDLFIFDADDTILESKSPVKQTRFKKNHELKKLKKSLKMFLKKNKDHQNNRSLFFSNALKKTAYQPVEKEFIDNILKIQKNKIKSIVLTAQGTGKFGCIEKLEDWRYKQLLNLGLDFSSSFDKKYIDLSNYKLASHESKKNGHVLYYKGILCSLDIPKGICLKAFIETIDWKPARIFFFDDLRKNAESVKEEMGKIGIECHTFVYRAAQKLSSNNQLDLADAKFQYELIKQRNDYVDYFEAAEIRANQK